MHVTHHSRLRVKIVPPKKNSEMSPKITQEQMLAALEVESSERTDQQIDTILQSLGQWPCFTRTIKSEQMRREVCRHAILERHERNTILFKQGDQPNGWFIILSGKCCVIQHDISGKGEQDMNRDMLQKLREEVGDHSYNLIVELGSHNAVGDTALIQEKPRNATIYISQKSLLARIDADVYRDTAAFFQKMQLRKRSRLFSSVKAFEPIRNDSDPEEKFSNIAENTYDFVIPPGSIIDRNHCELITQNTNKKEDADVAKELSIFVIAEGKLALSRKVNFSKYNKPKTVDKSAKFKVESDILKVRKPVGVRNVHVVYLGVSDVFPDPRLPNDWVPHQFFLKAIEPTVIHGIKISDLSIALPLTQVDLIRQSIIKQPTDEEIIDEWVKRQKDVQWNVYKKECVKDARRKTKIQKQIMNGRYGIRTPDIPKSIKSYVPLSTHKKSYLNSEKQLERSHTAFI